MKREQQQAQMQMALQLLQMLREGRQQDQKLELARQQMQNEKQMGRRQLEATMAGTQLKQKELDQNVELAKMQQDALLKQAEAKNQGLMNPAVLEYLQTTMQLPPGAERNALISNLEKMTNQTFERPVDQFQQLIKNTK